MKMLLNIDCNKSDPDGILPKNICQPCFEKLEVAYLLKEKSQESDRYLQNLLEQQRQLADIPVTPYMPMTMEPYSLHDEEEDEPSSSHGGDMFSIHDESSLLEPLEDYKVSRPKKEEREDNLMVPSRKANKEDDDKYSSIPRRRGERCGDFICSTCDRQFKYAKSYINHMKYHNQGVKFDFKGRPILGTGVPGSSAGGDQPQAQDSDDDFNEKSYKKARKKKRSAAMDESSNDDLSFADVVQSAFENSDMLDNVTVTPIIVAAETSTGEGKRGRGRPRKSLLTPSSNVLYAAEDEDEEVLPRRVRRSAPTLTSQETDEDEVMPEVSLTKIVKAETNGNGVEKKEGQFTIEVRRRRGRPSKASLAASRELLISPELSLPDFSEVNPASILSELLFGHSNLILIAFLFVDNESLASESYPSEESSSYAAPKSVKRKRFGRSPSVELVQEVDIFEHGNPLDVSPAKNPLELSGTANNDEDDDDDDVVITATSTLQPWQRTYAVKSTSGGQGKFFQCNVKGCSAPKYHLKSNLKKHLREAHGKN